MIAGGAAARWMVDAPPSGVRVAPAGRVDPGCPAGVTFSSFAWRLLSIGVPVAVPLGSARGFRCAPATAMVPPTVRAAKVSRSARGVAAGGVRSRAFAPGDSRGKRLGQSRTGAGIFRFARAVAAASTPVFFLPGENISWSRFFFCALVWMAFCAAASMSLPRAPGDGERDNRAGGEGNKPDFEGAPAGVSDDWERVGTGFARAHP